MTGITRLSGGYMSRSFTGGDHAVVAIFAEVSGLRVIERHNDRYKRSRCMTNFTGVRGQRVSCRFARCRHGVMAIDTRIRSLVMSEWKNHR